MHDKLREAMFEAYKSANWFAFRQAMDITKEIASACRAYDEEPDEAAKDTLVQAAENASSFLRTQNTSEAKSASQNLQSHLTTIRMEG